MRECFQRKLQGILRWVVLWTAVMAAGDLNS